ncbi:uncharacterized protein LOC131953287 [Physella acuta]|uniref:uncharacterized protein LOC131953287 n=1 Tax=Physella acuta TaxID=109671 RepID=UPI0027DB397F|nr:uncharacterized protein LOC131953287 [Physella acuta]
MEKHRSCRCHCLQNSVLLESVVITLTLVSVLAITGRNLLTFHLITVPEVSIGSGNLTQPNENKDDQMFTPNVKIVDLLDTIFCLTSLGIAALFMLEILLKVITLHKAFVTNPWQVFDSLVVIATLSAELIFYFMTFSEPALYSINYVVVLRLWRIPYVCSIKSRQTERAMTVELEQYKIKTEDRVTTLQNTVAKHEATILALQKGSALKTTDEKNSTPPTRGKDGRKNVPPKNLPTKAMKKTALPTIMSKISVEANSGQQETSFYESLKDSERQDSPPTDDILLRNQVNNNLSKSEMNIMRELPRSEASYNISELSKRPRQTASRIRKRRSSTSEYIDYSNMNSPDKNVPFFIDKDKCSSWPKLDVDAENILNQINVAVLDSDSHHSDKQTSSDSKSSPSNKVTKRRKRTKRFASCPEYVYTQRMSITNDESKLIGDDHGLDYPTMYDNIAYIHDDIRLQILAEFDGTKTYCNKDGIPMTSL